MKIYLLIISVSILFSSCEENISDFYPEPDNLLEQEKMIAVLTELSIVEAAYQMKYIQVSRYSALLQRDADSIFDKFNIDRNIFEESMLYYGHYQKELLEIYQEVQINLEKKQKELPEVDQESFNQIAIDSLEVIKSNQKETLDTRMRIRTEEDMKNL